MWSKFSKRDKIILIVLNAFLLVGGLLKAYADDYYRASLTCDKAMKSSETVEVQTLENGTIVFEPEQIKAGFIFYPGGKVENKAYALLLRECAEEGILCITPKMPFHLAVFDMDAAEGIAEQYPEVKKWYIGGHSLGGAMAASYLAEHQNDFDGLVLMAAYSTADLYFYEGEVLSVYGTLDGVLDMEKYREYRYNLPEDYIELVMERGCHSYFGSYGMQEGDAEHGFTLTEEEQRKRTVAFMVENLLKN